MYLSQKASVSKPISVEIKCTEMRYPVCLSNEVSCYFRMRDSFSNTKTLTLDVKDSLRTFNAFLDHHGPGTVLSFSTVVVLLYYSGRS